MTAATAVLVVLAAPSAFAQNATAYAAAGCAACHGADGNGTAAGPSLATGELTTEDFIAYVRRPAGRMPAYPAEAVSDESLARVLESLTPPGAALAPAGSVDAGAGRYDAIGCYQCHANEGQGGAQGPRIAPDPISFARFSWYLRHPTGSMPPYSVNVLSDQELADIYVFLEAQPQPPALESIPLLAP